jgi:hypothetical protein
VDALDAGESQTVTLGPWTAKAGAQTVTASADVDDALGEAEKANNDEAVTVNVASEDPGHAYEDIDNNMLFTPGTDAKIPDSEVQDGIYHISDPWSLVIPASVGSIETEKVNFTAGPNGTWSWTWT